MKTLADIFLKQVHIRQKEIPAEEEAEARENAEKSERLKKLDWHIDSKIMPFLQMLDEIETKLNQSNRNSKKSFIFDFGIPDNGFEFFISAAYSDKPLPLEQEPLIDTYARSAIKTPRFNMVFNVQTEGFRIYRGDICEIRDSDSFAPFSHRNLTADNISIVAQEFAQWCGNIMPERIDDLMPKFEKHSQLYNPEYNAPKEEAPPKRKRVLGIF